MLQKIVPGLFVLTLLTGPALAGSVPEGNKLRFDIYRDGEPFGRHDIDFSKDAAGDTLVDINIHMQYDMAFLTLFNYEHHNREIWQGDRILSVKSVTDDNGKAYQVDEKLQPGIFSSSYWNPDVLKTGKVLNTQKGMVEDITVTPRGVESFCTSVSGCRKAKVYDLQTPTSKGPIRVWYDVKTDQWVGLKFSTRGADIEYRRLTPLGGAAQASAQVSN